MPLLAWVDNQRRNSHTFEISVLLNSVLFDNRINIFLYQSYQYFFVFVMSTMIKKKQIFKIETYINVVFFLSYLLMLEIYLLFSF